MKNINFLEPAEQEMLNAASYYENKAKNLGVRFLKEIRNTIMDWVFQTTS